MKKVLSVLLVVLMVVCMSVSASAKKGEFVESPSKNPTPEIVEVKPGSLECIAQLIITSFLDRYDLPEELLQLMEIVYTEIKNSENIAELCNELKDIAKELGIPELNLAVSDLFDVRYEPCEEHKDHGYFDIVLKAETLKNFVALLHYTTDGWEVIDNARVEEVDGEWHLYFSVKDFSPFAIVVNSATVVENMPNTGDNNNVYIFAALMAVSTLAVLVVLKKKKKQEA